MSRGALSSVGIRSRGALARFASALAFALAAACILATVAAANTVADPVAWSGSGGERSETLPSDGHAIYAVPMLADDWFVAYSRAGADGAGTRFRLLAPGAAGAEEASVASAGAAGVLAYRAPADGTYLAVLEGDPGANPECGMFLSRPVLSIASSHARVIDYHGHTTLVGTLEDTLYDYATFDGPALAFERVRLERSSDGVHWTSLGDGLTDLNGTTNRSVSGISGTTYLRLRYHGAVYADCGFGEAVSPTVKVVPRAALTRHAPGAVRAGRRFRVSGTVRPRHPATGNRIVVQVRRAGTSQIRTFHTWVRPSSSGPTPLAASVVLPSRGRWSVRFLHPADERNAASVSRWVTVVAR